MGRSAHRKRVIRSIAEDLVTPAVARAMELAFSQFSKSLDQMVNAAIVGYPRFMVQAL